MNHRYAHILTPVRVGNLVLKNRLINSKSIPEGLQCQDPAQYMTEQSCQKWCLHCHLFPRDVWHI